MELELERKPDLELELELERDVPVAARRVSQPPAHVVWRLANICIVSHIERSSYSHSRYSYSSNVCSDKNFVKKKFKKSPI